LIKENEMGGECGMQESREMPATSRGGKIMLKRIIKSGA
jgi:hypothetical protein